MSDEVVSSLPFEFNEERLHQICRTYDVAMLGLFGSFSRGEGTSSSDIDSLVEFSVPKSLLNLISLEISLSNELGREVDLLTEAAISPYLRDLVKEDLQVIYDTR